jgi:hypothetical protein
VLLTMAFGPWVAGPDAMHQNVTASYKPRPFFAEACSSNEVPVPAPYQRRTWKAERGTRNLVSLYSAISRLPSSCDARKPVSTCTVFRAS